MGGRIKRDFIVDPIPPRLGKIHVGIKNERGLPQSVDWFVASGKYAPLFHEAYGDHPSTILVYFPSDDPELVCREEYIYRDDKGKKIASGDGETFEIWSEKKKERIIMTTEKFPNLMETISERFPSRSGWQISLTLNFVCPLVNKIYGCWTFETRAKASSIPHIRDCFDSMLERNGRIKGVLCDLNVAFAKVDSPSGGKFPVVSLVPNETKESVERIENVLGGNLLTSVAQK